MRMFGLGEVDRPSLCKQCDGIMVFRGVGEYKCEDCGIVEYDDYGKVRNYIEANPGANVATIADETGVTRKSINNMLKEERFNIAAESKVMLLCEMCGANIRTGRVCKKCEAAYHKAYEEDVRKKHIMGGYGMGGDDMDSGSKRFKRDVF